MVELLPYQVVITADSSGYDKWLGFSICRVNTCRLKHEVNHTLLMQHIPIIPVAPPFKHEFRIITI